MTASRSALKRSIDKDGFAIAPGLCNRNEIECLIDALSRIPLSDGVRTRNGVYAIRNLLHLSPEVLGLALSPSVSALAAEVLGPSAQPVRAILFDKTAAANWLVPWHQDLTIAVDARIDVSGYGPWSRKSGIWHVQPPRSVLESMISVRIHLDRTGENNGALRVIPGTHRVGRLTPTQIAGRRRSSDEFICNAEMGDGLLMRPLLLHASSAARNAFHRRVIHLDFASGPLEGGLRWATQHS